MLPINTTPVYVAREPIDMRKSIDGLSLIVSQVLQHDPFQVQLLVFTNRWRDQIKLLQWDTNGFWLYYQRLERGWLAWPERGSGQQVLKVQPRQLQWLLEGLALEQPRALKPVPALRVA